MPQLSYSIEHGTVYEGTRADSSPALVVSGLNKSGAEVKFGRFVALLPGGSNANLANLKPMDYVPFGPMVDVNSKIQGVLLHDMAHESPAQGTADGDMGSILKQGTVNVFAETAMKPGDPVFVRHTASGGNTQIGVIRNDADTATAVAFTKAEVLGACAIGGIVSIRLNLP